MMGRTFRLSPAGGRGLDCDHAVMLALILVACITIVTSLRTSVSGTFSNVNGSMSS